MGSFRDRFRLHSRSSSSSSQAGPSQPEISQGKKTKFGASEHLAIMLSLPATVAMLPTVPSDAMRGVGHWVGMIGSLKRVAMNQDERCGNF